MPRIRSTIARPAADRVARGRRRRQQPSHERLPHERRRQLAGVVVVGEDPGAARERVGGVGADVVGRPGAEVELDRRRAAAQPQRRDGGADGGHTADVVAPAEAHARQRRARVRRQQVALAEPAPERAARQQRVRSEVRLVGAVHAAGAAAELGVGLEQAHVGALLGAGDGGRQAGKAASDHRDLLHLASDPSRWAMWSQTVRGNWLAVKVQLWSIRESQFSDPICCCRSTAARRRRCTSSSSSGCASRSAAGGSRPDQGCRLRGRSPPSSASRAASCSRPTPS